MPQKQNLCQSVMEFVSMIVDPLGARPATSKIDSAKSAVETDYGRGCASAAGYELGAGAAVTEIIEGSEKVSAQYSDIERKTYA